MAKQGEWDFDRTLIVLEDHAELERVREAMRFQHPALSSFPFVHNHLTLEDASDATIEEKFWWFMEECKKVKPLPTRGSTSKVGRGNSVAPLRVVGASRNAAALVVSPGRGDPHRHVAHKHKGHHGEKSTIPKAKSAPEFKEKIQLKSSDVGRQEHLRKSIGSNPLDPNSQMSNARAHKKESKDSPKKTRECFRDETEQKEGNPRLAHLSDSEVQSLLLALLKQQSDLRKKKRKPTVFSDSGSSNFEDEMYKKKGKKKLSDSGGSSSDDEDEMSNRKGKKKLKSKKKRKSKSNRHKKKKRGQDGYSDSDNERYSKIPSCFLSELHNKDRSSDHRPVLELKDRKPIDEDLKAVLYKIRIMLGYMYPGWVHWKSTRRDKKNLLQFHREVRGVFRNGDELCTIWLEKKAASHLRNRRWSLKSAVKDMYNKEKGEYKQPEGMDTQMFKEIVNELVADKESKLHKRAHMGDAGSRGLRTVTVRTTNPWGQGGENTFRGNFKKQFNRPPNDSETEFAREWTFKELVRKMKADDKGVEWVPLPTSRSKSEKDKEWMANLCHKNSKKLNMKKWNAWLN